MVNRLARFIIRSTSFIGKEFVEILRQTRLILTLVLGPFLIMLLFGIGYRTEARPLRTVFVASQGDMLASRIEEYAETLGPQLIFQGVVSDQEEALRRLSRGEVDLVTVVPEDAETKIQNSEQATFILYHNEIDPYQVSYVQYFGTVYVDEVNRRVLMTLASEGQAEAADVMESLQAARASTRTMREALERGDAVAAKSEQRNVDTQIDALTLAVGGSLGLLAGVQETVGEDGGSGGTGGGGESEEIMAALNQLNESNDRVSQVEEDGEYQAEIQELREMETNLERMESRLSDFQSVSPNVLVSPFASETRTIANINITAVEFFAPAVVVLLLQHLGVTFAALSIVRERRSGIMELFRVSPLSPFESLFGKYTSYLIFGGLIALIITSTIVLALRMPMLGEWGIYALVLLAMLFASLGIGFIISLISQTDTQAVQYSMFILLGSVFFSGFFLDLRYLWEPVRAISWALPATYGIRMLQNIMLRGASLDPILFPALIGIGLLLFLISWLLLRRVMRNE
jgi:ABC-2 type transport system permease protein